MLEAAFPSSRLPAPTNALNLGSSGSASAAGAEASAQQCRRVYMEALCNRYDS